MPQIFHRSTNTLSKVSIFGAVFILAFVIWASWDGPRNGVDRWWVVIPASLLVGVCFAIPLYLYMRERAPAAASA